MLAALTSPPCIRMSGSSRGSSLGIRSCSSHSALASCEYIDRDPTDAVRPRSAPESGDRIPEYASSSFDSRTTGNEDWSNPAGASTDNPAVICRECCTGSGSYAYPTSFPLPFSTLANCSYSGGYMLESAGELERSRFERDVVGTGGWIVPGTEVDPPLPLDPSFPDEAVGGR